MIHVHKLKFTSTSSMKKENVDRIYIMAMGNVEGTSRIIEWFMCISG